MHKGYKCLHVPTGRVYVSRNVVFDELVFLFTSDTKQSASPKSIPESTLLPWLTVSANTSSPTTPDNHPRVDNSPIQAEHEHHEDETRLHSELTDSVLDLSRVLQAEESEAHPCTWSQNGIQLPKSLLMG